VFKWYTAQRLFKEFPSKSWNKQNLWRLLKQAVGGRPPRYAPPLSSSHGRRSARLTRPSRRQRRITFSQPTRSHAHRCSCLTPQKMLSKAAWWPLPLTLKVVSVSRVTWATSVPILVLLGLSVLDLGPMYTTDRRQTKALLNAPAYYGRGIII